MEYEILTGILKRFTIYLEDLPANLRLISHTLLFFLATIDIALTVYINMDNENFSYYKWIKNKILKLGFILFAINQYEWLLAGVKDFFFDVAGKAIRTNLFSNNEYFENPSELYSKGADLAAYIYKEGVAWYSPKSWIYIILSILIIIGFLMLAVQLIICWIEYYFLTGISIIFLPFGVLDIGLDFYKNVFKTIISCSIKLAVMNFWLRFSTVILNGLFKLTNKNIKMELVILIFGTLYVIVAIMQFMPSMTSGLLTGAPAVNASAAMAGATGAAKGVARGVADAYRGAKETVKGAWKGGQTGANVGGAAGTALGSLGGSVGMSVGKIVGGTIGAVGGAAVGGSYAGARYAIFKEKAKTKDDDDNGGNSSNNSSSGNTSSGTSSQSGSSGNNSSYNSNLNNNGTNPGSSSQSAPNTSTSGSSNGNSSSGSGNGGGTSNSGSTSQTINSSNNGINLGNSSQPAPNTSTSGSSNENNSLDDVNSGGSSNSDSTSQAPSNPNDNSTQVVDTNTGATNSTPNSNTSSSIENNTDNSNTDATNNGDAVNNSSADIGDSSGKRGIKVNGGEAGKLPDWMKDDY